ncbi:peptide deformylase [Devosia sp. ZW T5_3]|uniref:peptide deformylase n=1 Tax=Devosia sp. ZW T5_3 TaxID=3378085 RepID=UPI00385294D5
MPDFVVYPHPALSRAATPRPVDEAMLEAGDRLLAAAREAQAYGLAAAHLGENEPLVVMSMASDPAQRDYRLLYNPEIVAVAEETASGPEGSVSMPGIEVAVQRPVWAEIAYDDADGIRQRERLEGFVARVALHEIEQVNGIFFLSRVSRLKRDAALRKFDKSRRA